MKIPKRKGCTKQYAGVRRYKIKHLTKELAEQHAIEMTLSQGLYYSSYRCKHCRFYHIGHLGRDKREDSYTHFEEALVGKLIAALKHVINGEPMPHTKSNLSRQLHVAPKDQ